MELSPAIVLAMWAAGLAAAVAVVAWWDVVGPGYVWLGGGVALLFGLPAIAAGSGAWAVVGSIAVAVGTLLGRFRMVAVVGIGAGATGFLVAAMTDTTPVLAVTGALFLGGITSEMMLGHWFLVDPRLPRWALKRLDAAGALGGAADAVALVVLGAIPWAEGDLVVGAGFLLLAVTTLVLAGAVWASLGEPGYSGVMAATGLSYLATLTAVGAAVVGRLLLEGPVLS
ncbi:MAG: hypothetical protein R3290_12570 [Acidimicrobiia bacterium]|nr:hypothetical protein [Acidimicrobiia bacterium]